MDTDLQGDRLRVVSTGAGAILVLSLCAAAWGTTRDGELDRTTCRDSELNRRRKDARA